MKILPTIAGLIIAGSFATSANAAPSKGEIMTLCKQEIKSSIDDVTRIRTNKFKDRASGTYVSYRVSLKDRDTQKVTCSFVDGVASLTDSDGAMIASKTATKNTGS